MQLNIYSIYLLYQNKTITQKTNIMKLITFKIKGLLNNKNYETYLMGINIVDALKSLPTELRIQSITPLN